MSIVLDTLVSYRIQKYLFERTTASVLTFNFKINYPDNDKYGFPAFLQGSHIMFYDRVNCLFPPSTAWIRDGYNNRSGP